MASLKRLAAFLIALLWSTAPSLAERRVAFVIGSAAYRHAPALANPSNDAEGMAAALKRLNFDVVLGVDLDESGTRRQLKEFLNAKAGRADD